MRPYDPKETEHVLAMLGSERVRQEALVAAGKLRWNCRDDTVSDESKTCPLIEEVGEVGKAIHEKQGMNQLRTELIQVAAICVAWVESINEVEDR
jgi:NTP pyrophosphatase (non-canonical NTP hydrolase)